jgi:DNA-directed RNA polymerase specialized sigma24 family protein
MGTEWEAAFWQTYREYGPRLLVYARCRIGWRGDLGAEDVCQEIWLRFLRF